LDYLSKSTDGAEAKTVYATMKADCIRYQQEMQLGVRNTSLNDDAVKLYNQALEYAKVLKPTHPVILYAATNYAVFLYEILDFVEKAIETSKHYFDSALFAMEGMEEASAEDSFRCMQVLRDNFTLWQVDKKMENKDNDFEDIPEEEGQDEKAN